MKKTVVFCVFVLLIALLSHAEDFGSIHGQVRRAGKPIGGVDVILVELSRTTITDKDGVYIITRIPPGKYTLVYTQGDNSITKEDVAVLPRTTTKHDVDVEWEALLIHEVTVYAASRRTERVIDAPAAVNVVEEAEIEREAAHSQLPKILETTPGVDIAQNGLYDFNINSRGFNSFMNRRVLTFIDGMDMSNVPGGNQEWDRYSSYLHDISSMEMIRGPGSALYGANAFSGVLSITTKSPRYSQGGHVRLSIGEMRMGLLDLRYAGRLGKEWYFSLLGSYMESGDFTVSRNISVEYEGLPLDAVPVPRDKSKRMNTKIRLDKHFSGGSILTFEASALNYWGKTFLTALGRMTGLDTPILQGRINFKSPHWNILAYGYISDWEGLDLTSGEQIFSQNHRLQGEVQGFTDFAGGKGRIVGGFSLRKEGTDTANKQGIQTWLPEAKDNHTESVFSQLDYNFTEKIKVVLAGRVDFSSFYKTRFSPKVSALYTFNPGHSLRLSFNQAFLTPVYTALYIRWPVAPPIDLSDIENGLSLAFGTDLNLGFEEIPVQALGNENLKVEEIKSFEIGYSNIFGRRIQFHLNYYRNEHKNFPSDLLPLINPDYGPYSPPSHLATEIQVAILETLKRNLPPDLYAIMSNSLEDGSPIFAALSITNTGRINTQGVELGLNYFINNNLRTYFNYTWFDFKIKEWPIGRPESPNTPEHRVSLGISYVSKKFDISIRNRWVDDFLWATGVYRGMVNSYNLIDLTSNIHFANGFSFGLNIFNLFNNKHYQLFGGDLLHRRAVATLSYRW